MKFLLIVALALCVCAVSANPGDGQVQDVTYTVLKDANYVLSLQKVGLRIEITSSYFRQVYFDLSKTPFLILLRPINPNSSNSNIPFLLSWYYFLLM